MWTFAPQSCGSLWLELQRINNCGGKRANRAEPVMIFYLCVVVLFYLCAVVWRERQRRAGWKIYSGREQNILCGAPCDNTFSLSARS